MQLIEASDRDDLIARLSTSIAGGSPPDLFLINYRFYGQFAAKDAIEPMERARRGLGRVRGRRTSIPRPLDAFRWQGEQLCLPQNVSSLVVYYNRDLFEQYGVPEPQAGWTWNDLVATRQALTRDAKARRRKGDGDRGRTVDGRPSTGSGSSRA